MAFMGIFMIFVVFIMLCIFAVGLVGIALLIAGFITGHENKKALEIGRRPSDVHIGLKVAGVLLMIPSALILLFFFYIRIKSML